MRSRRWLAALALLASCSVLTRATVSDVQKAAGTAKKVFIAIEDLTRELSPENEYWVGRSVATNILARHEYRYRDAAALRAGRLEGLTVYVSRVGGVVAAAAMDTPRQDDRPPPLGGWHFVVLESDAINAFAAPGGWVFVTTGAIAAAKSEDELAAVLAHEVAHVVRGHALGTIKKSRYAKISKEVLHATGVLSSEELGKLTTLLEGSIDDMLDAMFVKGYSRDTEFEADRLGLHIMVAAGYDPKAFIAYLRTLHARQDTGEGGAYATHPKAADRIARLEAELSSIAGAKRIEGRRKVPRARTARFVAATRELR